MVLLIVIVLDNECNILILIVFVVMVKFDINDKDVVIVVFFIDFFYVNLFFFMGIFLVSYRFFSVGRGKYFLCYGIFVR